MNYTLGIVILDFDYNKLNWLTYDTIKINDLYVNPDFFSIHKKEWHTFYNENIDSISNHEAYKHYPKTKHLLRKCNIDIIHIQQINYKDIAIIKTFWLREFQRTIKQYIKIKQQIFKKLMKRELLGRHTLH